jgi:copper(I)-binding protein
MSLVSRERKLFLSAGLLAAVAVSVSVSVAASEFRKNDLVIEQPHAASTAPGQPHGAVFIRSITNTGSAADQLIGGKAAVARSVEVHRMEMDNNVMKMREIPGIDLPPNSKVMMGRGNKDGFHLMLMNLSAPLKAGETIPVTLVFKRAGEVNVTVTVEKQGAGHGHGGHKH